MGHLFWLSDEAWALPQFVDRLDTLKGQRYPQGYDAPAGSVVLSLPNQFRPRLIASVRRYSTIRARRKAQREMMTRRSPRRRQWSFR